MMPDWLVTVDVGWSGCAMAGVAERAMDSAIIGARSLVFIIVFSFQLGSGGFDALHMTQFVGPICERGHGATKSAKKCPGVAKVPERWL